MKSFITNKYIVLVFYLFQFVIDTFALAFLSDLEQALSKSFSNEITYLGQFRHYFFTIWNFLLQLFFISIAILDECSALLGLPLAIQKRLSRTRAFLFSTLVFPSSLLVSTVFWSLWSIDRELIFPKAIDEFYPSWLNHMLHTFILLPLVIELLLPKKYNFVKFQRAAPVIVVYLCVYQFLFLSVYLRHGIWLYPVYKIMDWPQRILFTFVKLGVTVGFQKIGISIQNCKKSNDKDK